MKLRKGSLIKRGDNYYVRWKVDGKQFQKVLRDGEGRPITSKRAAEKAKDEYMTRFRLSDEAQILQAIAGRVSGLESDAARLEDESVPRLLIRDGWAAYLKCHNRPDSGDRTLHEYGIQYRQWATWMGKTFPRVEALRDVNTEHAERFMDHLSRQKRSANTMNKYRGLLSLVFRVLKDKARITANPWESIKPKGLKTESRRELTLSELRTVCEAADGCLRPLFALGLYTGLRLGDCATLKWGEVDLERGIIRRIPNKSRKGKPVLIPIHPVLRGILNELPGSGIYVIPEAASCYNHHPSYLTNRIQRHFKACGIDTIKAGTGATMTKGKDGKLKWKHTGKRAVVEVGFHSLRHSFVSLSRNADVPLAVVEAIVGHANPAMTRHYTHIGEAAALSAVAALPSVIGEDTPLPAPKGDRDACAILRDQIGKIADKLNGENWQEVRQELRKLTGADTGKPKDPKTVEKAKSKK